MLYKITVLAAARKDAKKLERSHLKNKCLELLHIIAKDPYDSSTPYKELSGKLTGTISRRINAQHRLVYEVDQSSKEIIILRMWSHYE